MSSAADPQATNQSRGGRAGQMRISPFRLFLLASCLAAATAGWLTAAALAERAALAVVALTAALLLLLGIGATGRHEPRTQDESGNKTTTRRPARPRTRKAQRLVALEMQLSSIQAQLDAQAQALRNLAQRLGQADGDADKRLAQLEQHVLELETVTEQQRVMFGQHLPRLRQAIAAHRGNLAALERQLDTSAPGTRM